MSNYKQADFAQMKEHFFSGATTSYQYRKAQLKVLQHALNKNEQALTDALFKDLHKSQTESYFSEIGILQIEIRHALKNLAKWMEPKQVNSPLVIFPSESRIVRDPLGVVLIIAPWNYPLMLLLAPLVGAIAGGNCTVLKPSEYTPHTSAVVAKMLAEHFDPRYIKVVEGDGALVVPQMMHENRFDHVFFTGSKTVGKEIAKMAAEKLVPVTLELGGKSPCIVDADADIDIAARRITWGKFTNAGQTCVAPDYLLVHESIKEKLIERVKHTIRSFYTDNPKNSPDFGRIVNRQRFDKLVSYLQQGKVIEGGKVDEADLYIAPTIMLDVTSDVAVMKEEIFGPVLPVISFINDEEVQDILQRNPNPLAFYYFGNDKKKQEAFMNKIRFGGGCINNTLVHLGNLNLPFGGVGQSGVGAYHGKYSFDTFTREKSIVHTANWLDPSVKYPPYQGKLKYLKWFFRI